MNHCQKIRNDLKHCGEILQQSGYQAISQYSIGLRFCVINLMIKRFNHRCFCDFVLLYYTSYVRNSNSTIKYFINLYLKTKMQATKAIQYRAKNQIAQSILNRMPIVLSHVHVVKHLFNENQGLAASHKLLQSRELRHPTITCHD